LDVLKIIEKKGHWVGELVARRKDGSAFDVELAANLIKGGRGNPVFMMGSFVDISKRKKAEAELRKTGEFLKNIINTIPDPIFVKDEEHKLILMNNASCERMGCTAEELIGKSDHDLFPKEHADVLREKDEQVFREGKTIINEEEIIVRGRSQVISILKTLFEDTFTGNKYIVGTIRDITQHKMIERVRRAAEEEFRSIFENITDGVLLAEPENKRFYTGNKTICRMLGYTLDEIRNLRVNDIHSPEDLPYVLENFEKQTRGEITLAKDIPVKRKNGSVFYADVNSAPLDIGGKTYLMGVFRDVTVRKQTEQELKDRRELLDRANKELERKISELQNAIKHIKRLEGMFPICASCKKMLTEGCNPKDPKAWVPLERYISERTDANFTHGMCPECTKKIYEKGKTPRNEAG
jgi:PAS domain S-box-containing protein